MLASTEKESIFYHGIEAFGDDDGDDSEHNLIPVSYTHLDVYKRQVIPKLMLYFSNICVNSITYIFMCPFWLPDNKLPVSYTHLDVYKRQRFANPPSGATQGGG